MRITRQLIISRMWAAGMPCNDHRFADVYFAARKAGLDNAQAYAMAAAAFHAAKGYVDNLGRSTNWLRVATLEKKAADAPVGLYAYAKHKLGLGYRYATDEEITHIHHHDFAGWSTWADAQRAAGVPS